MLCSRLGSNQWQNGLILRLLGLSRALQLGILLAIAAPRSALAQSEVPAPADEPPRADVERPELSDVERPELSDAAEVSRAASLYESGQLEQCVIAFEELLSAGGRTLEQPDPIERARVYLAACLIGVGELEQAEKVFAEAIRANPQMRPPDSLVFPPEVIDVFLRIRESLLEEIRQAAAERLKEAEQRRAQQRKREQAETARLRELERLATEETVVVQNRRWIAAIPFGVGQFQNGDTGLGWAFLASEVLLTAVVVGGIAVELENYALLDPAPGEPTPNRADITRNANLARDIYTVALYSLVGVAAGGIIEAQLSYVPEFVTVRQRPLPPALRRPPQSGLKLQPNFAASSDAAVFGVGGRF